MTRLIDWQGCAGVATGLMGWPPEDFWRATPHEFLAAWSLWAKAHGLGGEAPARLDGEGLAALKARFPDR
ncbi:MAG: phage tail assembly chaperone [Pseudomonadota bacterium]|jgi:hypothetical protein